MESEDGLTLCLMHRTQQDGQGLRMVENKFLVLLWHYQTSERTEYSWVRADFFGLPSVSQVNVLVVSMPCRMRNLQVWGTEQIAALTPARMVRSSHVKNIYATESDNFSIQGILSKRPRYLGISVIPLLGLYPKNPAIPIQKNLCTPTSITAQFTIAKCWTQSKCASVDEWVKKLWYTYTMEYNSCLPYAPWTGMDPTT